MVLALSFVLAFSGPKKNSREFVQAQMKTCFSSGGKNQCYRKAAEAFLKKLDIEQILEIFRTTEKIQEIFARCHEVTHYLGRAAYDRKGSVPAAYAVGSDVCHGGFYHGVLEAHFKKKDFAYLDASNEELAREIVGICGRVEDYEVPRTHSECIHGIGHAMMFITEADLPRSLGLCDPLTGVSLQEVCYSGVFMENSSSSTNFDHPTKYLRADDPLYPCTALPEKYLKLCYKYQSSYFAELTRWDWRQTIDWCFRVPPAYRAGCFNVIGSNQVGYQQDISVMLGTCDLILQDNEARRNCIRGVVDGLAGRYVGDASRIVSFCALNDAPSKPVCYSAMGRALGTWTRDAQRISGLCGQIEGKDYMSLCAKPTEVVY